MPPLTLARFLPYRLSVVSNRMSDRIARAYRSRFGLKIPEWRILAVLAERGTATQAELVERTAMDKMTVSRGATALVERGLLARAPAADRRTLVLKLTREGLDLYREVAPAALDIEARMIAELSAQDRQQLLRIVDLLDNCLKK